MSEPLLFIEGARVELAGRCVASSLSLTVTGRRAVLVGDASSILLPLFGKAQVTAGTFTVLGQPLSPALSTTLGLAPLDPELPLSFSPREYVTWGARLAGLPAQEAKARASAVCELAQIDAWAIDRPLRQLGLVLRRLTVIAQAAVLDPALLVVAYPLDDLDPAGATLVLGAIGRLTGERAALVTAATVDANTPGSLLIAGSDEIVPLWQTPPAAPPVVDDEHDAALSASAPPAASTEERADDEGDSLST